jgi:acetyltransferase
VLLRISRKSARLTGPSTKQLARRTTHEALTRVCFLDYDREMVLVAERRGEGPADREILAMASLTKLSRKNHGEVAVLVRDDYQRHGLGTELVRRLVDVARDEHLDCVVASTMTDNHGMCTVFDRLGFALSIDGNDVTVQLDLRRPSPPHARVSGATHG